MEVIRQQFKERGGGGREERWPGLILPTAYEDSATVLIPFVQKRLTLRLSSSPGL